jgi:hypothetical protein
MQMRIWNFRNKILVILCTATLVAGVLMLLHHHGNTVHAIFGHDQKRRINSHPKSARTESLPPPTAPYASPRIVAQISDPDIDESSGLAASRANPGTYWTHNDSGDGPFIYAFDEKGARRGVWRVNGAKARDWEGIAVGPGPDKSRSYIYAGDIGDNSEHRMEIVVYRLPEPTITAADLQSTKMRPSLTEPADVITLKYPDGSHDSECLLVHPITGDLYVLTKRVFAHTKIFKASAPLDTKSTITMKLMGKLEIPTRVGGVITDGVIAPDGRRVALCDYLQGYELVLPDAIVDFDEIWKQQLKTIGMGERQQGEAITYRLDGRALLATSEGTSSPLIEIVHH